MSDETKSQDEKNSRRDIVKGIALGVGGVSVSQWSKPVVETIVLPAHAQTTREGETVLERPLQGGARAIVA